MNKRQRALVRQVVLYGLLVLVLLWTLVPLLWMVLSSFKPSNDLLATTPKVVFTPTLDHYRGLVTGGNDVRRNVKNSLIAAGLSTVIAVTLGSLAGYGLARSHFRGKEHVSFWILGTRMAPIAAVLLPLYIVFRSLRLVDTLPGLVIAYLSFNLPFAIWLMNAFFVDLPKDLEEAALVDGAGRFETFWRIALPLTAPGMVTTGVLCLVFAWNDYAFARTFAGPNSQTLPLAASQLITQTGINWGQLTAIGTIVAVPMVIVGLAVRRWLVEGLTMGAVTGQ